MASALDPLVKEIIDFEQLQTFINQREGNLIDLTKTYYCCLGSDLGFDVSAPYTLDISNTKIEYDICWITANNIEVAFEFELGDLEGFFAALCKLSVCEPELGVILVSHKSRILNLDLATKLAQKTQALRKKLLLVDISSENFELV
ncbi:MAG: hypothetical protein N3F05_01080 [Candidatus Diapherotrites archaeon]|nr:hypothetical protein [Candidatus Diapherotrites archaeon]